MSNDVGKKFGRNISVKENAEQSALICAEERIPVIPYSKQRFSGFTGEVLNEWYDPGWVFDTCMRDQSKISYTVTGIYSGLTAITTSPDYFPIGGLEYLIEHQLIEPSRTHILACSERLKDQDAELRSHIIFLRSGPEIYDEHILEKFPFIKINPSGSLKPITAGVVDCLCGNCGVWEYDYELGQPGLPGDIQLVPDALSVPKVSLSNQSGTSIHGKHKVGKVQRQLLDPVTEGGRNNELTRRAGIIFGTKKMPFDEGLLYLREINRQCCQPPLDDAEVVRTAKSIFKRASKNG